MVTDSSPLRFYLQYKHTLVFPYFDSMLYINNYIVYSELLSLHHYPHTLTTVTVRYLAGGETEAGRDTGVVQPA